jgi:hypothetical protein
MKCDSSWIPRSIGILKCNVIVFSNNKLKSSGIGGVLTDHEGRFIYIFSCSMKNMESNKDEILKFEKLCFWVVMIAMLLQINGL